MGHSVQIYVSAWNCEGDILSDKVTVNSNHWCSCIIDGHTMEDSACRARGYAGGYYGYNFDEVYDVRTAGMKANGCCPADLLPSAPAPVTVANCCDLAISNFNVSPTTINRDSGGKFIFSAEITSASPYSWTLTVKNTDPSLISSASFSGSAAGTSEMGAKWNITNKLVDPGTYKATLTATDDVCTEVIDKVFYGNRQSKALLFLTIKLIHRGYRQRQSKSYTDIIYHA